MWPLPIAVYTAYTEGRTMLAYAEARALLARLSESSMTQASTAETGTEEASAAGTGAAETGAAGTGAAEASGAGISAAGAGGAESSMAHDSAAVTSAAGMRVAEANAAVTSSAGAATSAVGTKDGRGAADAPEDPAGDSHDELGGVQHSMPGQHSRQAGASFQQPGKGAEPVEDPVPDTANITHKSACQRGSGGSIGDQLQTHSAAVVVVVAAVAAAAVVAGCGWVYGHVF